MPHKASITNDLTIVYLLVTPHDHFGPAPAPPPIYLPIAAAHEMSVPMFWPPGMAAGQNKFAGTVRHKGLPITQKSHDCGMLIPHVQVIPSIANALTLAKHMPFSSRKSVFGSSKVKMQGMEPAANTLAAWPPTPMLYCGDPVSLPFAGAPTALGHTVQFEMSMGDYVEGWIDIAVTMAIDFAVSKIPGGDALTSGAQHFVRGAAEWLVKTGLGKAYDGLKDYAKERAASDGQQPGAGAPHQGLGGFDDARPAPPESPSGIGSAIDGMSSDESKWGADL